MRKRIDFICLLLHLIFLISVTPEDRNSNSNFLVSLCGCPSGYFEEKRYAIYVLETPDCPNGQSPDSSPTNCGVLQINATQCRECHKKCLECDGPSDLDCLKCNGFSISKEDWKLADSMTIDKTAEDMPRIREKRTVPISIRLNRDRSERADPKPAHHVHVKRSLQDSYNRLLNPTDSTPESEISIEHLLPMNMDTLNEPKADDMELNSDEKTIWIPVSEDSDIMQLSIESDDPSSGYLESDPILLIPHEEVTSSALLPNNQINEDDTIKKITSSEETDNEPTAKSLSPYENDEDNRGFLDMEETNTQHISRRASDSDKSTTTNEIPVTLPSIPRLSSRRSRRPRTTTLAFTNDEEDFFTTTLSTIDDSLDRLTTVDLPPFPDCFQSVIYYTPKKANWERTNFVCVSECPDGFYADWSRRECKACDKKCQTCVGPSFMNCTSCASGLVQSHQAIQKNGSSTIFTCISECPFEQFNNSGICAPCHVNCNGCVGAGHTHCIHCQFGKEKIVPEQGIVICEAESSERLTNLEIILPLCFIVFLIALTTIICIRWHVELASVRKPFINVWKKCTLQPESNDILKQFPLPKGDAKRKIRNDYTPGPPVYSLPNLRESDDGYELPLPSNSNSNQSTFRTRTRRNDDPLPPTPECVTIEEPVNISKVLVEEVYANQEQEKSTEKKNESNSKRRSNTSNVVDLNNPQPCCSSSNDKIFVVDNTYSNSEGLYANC